MPREILFRAWDTKEKCWVGGFCIHSSGTYSDLANAKIENGIPICDMHWQEIPEHIIVEQYTGFNDKNDNKIFEGDKLVCDYSYIEIIWSEELCGYSVIDYEGDSEPLYNWDMNDFEVIGNIHDEVSE